MQVTIIDNQSLTQIGGPRLRAPKIGPELDLVDSFLSEFHARIRVPNGCSVTIFREPRLQSGFPDLVAVVWHVATAMKWNSNSMRANLSSADLKVMHYLVNHGPATIDSIETVFGSKVSGNLSRLEESDLTYTRGSKYSARSLAKTYATRHIIAVEAKIDQWSEVLGQAYLNTWFASSSFVLVPRLPKNSKFEERAKEMGIGIWLADDMIIDICKMHPPLGPLSYTSWLFNEWSWRASKQIE